MIIKKATYGNVNCTEILQKKVKNNILIIHANNNIIGDPSPGTVKHLDVEIEHDEKIHNLSIEEGKLLVFPLSTKRKLGIFYSNNNTPEIYPAIRASLTSIKKAAEGKADIITCMWQPEPENPFVEYIAWTKTSSHLNQLLQIMQLLYCAREIHNYEYVSFLEHDVLYPEGYFDYPEFNNNEVITNMNYMGVNKMGWQNKTANHEPFHQMTMKFNDAILHCEEILANALITNSGMIEPQYIKRRQWNCVNPAVHINHGKHFTSHYSIYKTHDLYLHQPYWGAHSDYLNLL